MGQLIKSRRSVRVWQAKSCARKLITQAIELATYAPNAGNQQNWRFYVVTNPKTITAIADSVQKSADEMALPESEQLGEAPGTCSSGPVFFRAAPVLILVAASQYNPPLNR